MRDIKTREGYDLWDKLHALPRFNFWRGGEDEKGSVIRVPEKHGNWLHVGDMETLVDEAQDELNSLRGRLARLAPAAAPDFDAEHALRLEAERQVGELREQLDASQADVNGWRAMCLVAMEGKDDLRTKLEKAMGLLNDMKKCRLDHVSQWIGRIDAFINTASTEGKDYE